MEQDRISNLPGNIIDQILSLLPFKDAARTSVLSRNWRHKWAELPYLEFRDWSLPIGFKEKSEELARIVDHVLLLHIGPILNFKLFFVDLRDHNSFDRWIFHLSRFPINELEFITVVENYSMPSCLFSFRSLTSLVLSFCALRPPSTFKGFPNLKNLDISNINITQHAFENLISSCPVLERLSVSFSNHISHVTINVPHLRSLHVLANLESISFENTYCLAEVFLIREQFTANEIRACRSSRNLLKFFLHLPLLRTLQVDSFFLKHLGVGIEPYKPPLSFVNLDHLTLRICLDDKEDFLRALFLLSISPNLTELIIMVKCLYGEKSVTERATNFLRDDRWNCLFTKLRFIKFFGCGISGTLPELKFVEFMLLNSPVLEKVEFMPSYKCNLFKLKRKLCRLKRASEGAQIISML